MINPAIIRILKIVALVGFALPWLTVSCQNTKILEARGYELVLGQELKPAPAFQQTMEQTTKGLNEAMGGVADEMSGETTTLAPEPSEDMKPYKPDPVVQGLAIGSAAVILFGLLIGFALRDRVFAAVSAVAGFAGAGLAYGTLQLIQTGFHNEISKGQSAGDSDTAAFQSMAAAAFQFSIEPGAWLTIGASALAGLVGLFVLMTPTAKPAEAAAPPPQSPVS